MSEIIQGPLWAGINWAADGGTGSIHDDETAEKLGFRGGTVPGDVHMNQFPPVMIQAFGVDWFERGHLSLDFKNATVDGELVRVFAERPESPDELVKVWMEREDGMLVCTGSAGLGNQSRSALRDKDLRACEPDQLKILRRVKPGMSLLDEVIRFDPTKQYDRYDRDLISDPIEFYRTGSKWGDVVACPCTFVEYFWGPPTANLRPYVENAVGLFGAIEIGHVNGPLLMNREYRVTSHVVSVGESPKTEYLWFDSEAHSLEGKLIANFRMMLRFMKDSA